MKILKISRIKWLLLFLACSAQTIRPELVLDETFGVGGRGEEVDVDRSTATIRLQPDSKIITFSFDGSRDNVTLTRYNANGIPDTTFGQNGTGRILKTTSSEHLDIKVQPDGTLVTALLGRNLILNRYHTNGSLSETTEFRNPYGWIKTLISDRAHPLSLFSRIVISAIALQSDGKLIAVGNIVDDPRGNNASFIARCNADFTPDLAFGPDGTGLVIITNQPYLHKVILQPDGKIIINHRLGVERSYLTRYTSTGAVDTTFGPNGVGIDTQGLFTSITVQNDKIIGALENRIVRYNVDGTLDLTFGPEGINLTTPLTTIKAIAVQPDEKIIVIETHGPSPLARALRGPAFLTRYRPLNAEEMELRRLAAQEERRLAALAAQEAAQVASDINALMKIELMEECAICMEQDSIHNFEETPCRHLFHPACIRTWTNPNPEEVARGLMPHTTCPLCRTALDREEVL